MAIGADSTRCLVHQDFRCIVVVSVESAQKMDPPLLNRFEKQVYQRQEIEEDNKRLEIYVMQLRGMIDNLLKE